MTRNEAIHLEPGTVVMLTDTPCVQISEYDMERYYRKFFGTEVTIKSVDRRAKDVIIEIEESKDVAFYNKEIAYVVVDTEIDESESSFAELLA